LVEFTFAAIMTLSPQSRHPGSPQAVDGLGVVGDDHREPELRPDLATPTIRHPMSKWFGPILNKIQSSFLTFSVYAVHF
jgi:hypothetical protein